MGLGKVWQNVYVCGIGLFSYLTYLHFKKKIVEGNKHRCVNKTSRDKGGACANEKRKRCNQIPSEITLGRNYPSTGYDMKTINSITDNACLSGKCNWHIKHLHKCLVFYEELVQICSSSSSTSCLVVPIIKASNIFSMWGLL